MESGAFYNENKSNRLRRLILAAVILLTVFIQCTGGLFPRPWGVPAMLAVVLTVCVGMFEREIWGMLFGLFAGILLDAFSTQSLCFNSISLTLIGFVSGILITRLLRNNLKTCFILSVSALFLYNTLYFIFCCVSLAGESANYIYTNIYLASVIYSGFFIPIFYIIIRAIEKKSFAK